MWLEYSDGLAKTATPQESILYTRGLLSLQCIDRSVQSWLGHATHASLYGLRRSVFNAIAFRTGKPYAERQGQAKVTESVGYYTWIGDHTFTQIRASCSGNP
jgi:hypothetical protein